MMVAMMHGCEIPTIVSKKPLIVTLRRIFAQLSRRPDVAYDVDCLINNAGIGIIGLFEDQESITNQTSVMDVNFWGSVNVTHFALPHLRKSKGRIVVIGSYGGWFNTPKVSVYNASKAAQQSFFESLRLELAPDIGITVITLGLVNTRLATNEFIYKTNLDRIPLVSVEGCANAIVNGVRRGDEHLT
ncbi:hypothetical protein E3N88_10105 [Mikania micrantha]|uniref:Uncharacterized protein n=1 Tax=Mikania micrantha TaxID=192012 RepID=A0A5N6PBH5_9ASTR|nr:hypothetical protein E3N88_10105 [Mikania micrantha]